MSTSGAESFGFLGAGNLFLDNIYGGEIRVGGEVSDINLYFLIDSDDCVDMQRGKRRKRRNLKLTWRRMPSSMAGHASHPSKIFVSVVSD